MNETTTAVAFWALAIVTLGSALMVAVVRDLVHAVLFLILSFVGVAGLYLTLSADFVAVVQILIYAGAVSVLMLFAILLTPLASAAITRRVSFAAPISVAGRSRGRHDHLRRRQDGLAHQLPGRPLPQTAREIGKALLDPFVLPFEVASVLLVVAMVGAIMLVRPG